MRRLALILAALTVAVAAWAQEEDGPAALLADEVYVSEGLLIAEGAVEVVYERRRLKAKKIVYLPEEDRILVEGPIVLIDRNGDRFLGEEIRIDRELELGIIRGARIVLNRQLQIAANEAVAAGDRYVQLTRAVASACRVCAAKPVPLWEIRSERVVLDRDERQIYFTKAQFRVAGVPVAYLPRLRLPLDDRARGFLRPGFETSSLLGFGIKIPYFIPLGESRDITLSPYISLETRTLEYRYRQAFRNGELEINGAFTSDDLQDGPRAYVFAEAEFRLPRDFVLGFDLELASDDDYLAEYDISEKDRLDSSVTLDRVREDELIVTRATRYSSLRLDDNGETLPFVEGRGEYVRRFDTGRLGGTAELSVIGSAYARESIRGFDTPADDDTTPDGRDATRLGARFDWRRSDVLSGGVEATVLGRLDAQSFGIVSDDAFPDMVHRLVPTAGVELRWPHERRSGARREVIEPIVQVLWTDPDFERAPNEDSTRVAFDEGNLFAISRFPGTDRIERGLRLNAGVTYTGFGPGGSERTLTLGRVFRDEDRDQFAEGSGLDGRISDWLASGHLILSETFAVEGRLLFDDEFDVSQGEARGRFGIDNVVVDAGYVWLSTQRYADGIARPQTSELTLAAAAQLSPAWGASIGVRYDFEARRTAESELALRYENECARANFTVEREFTSADALSPETRFGLSVSLKGFSDRDSVDELGVCSPYAY